MSAYEIDVEKAELLSTLGRHRFFLTNTVRGLSDEQAASHPTVSELCLGGLIKHVGQTERQWARFIVSGAAAFGSWDEDGAVADADQAADWANAFQMTEGETLEGILAGYAAIAEETAQIVAGVTDMSSAHALPEAPWFEAGATWSARRVLLHLIAETSQHAGHADILRETIDGQKSMG